MLSLDLFWTYFRLLHLNRILNRVIRIAVIVTTGCHFYFIAREKVYFDATGFLAVIIRNRYYCTVFLILRFNFFPPRQVSLIVTKARKSICITKTCFPLDFYRHSRFPFWRHTKVTRTAAALPRADNIDARLPVDTKVVDSQWYG